MHRSISTTSAIAACGILIALMALGGAVAQTAAPAAPQTQAAPQAAQPAPQAGQRAAVPSARAERRRRTSYAFCNRQSHLRGLRGGARRRFLVRCKLGYERPKPVPAQPAAPPGRQP